MKNKKSFKELVKQMEVLQENQQGKLKGGFSSYSSSNFAAYKEKDNSNSVSVSVGGDPCSCNCQCG